MVTKTTIQEQLRKEHNLTKAQAKDVFETVIKCMEDGLINGEKVRIQNFGTFEAVDRSARKGRNPQNPKEVIEIPAYKTVRFKASKILKTELNKG